MRSISLCRRVISKAASVCVDLEFVGELFGADLGEFAFLASFSFSASILASSSLRAACRFALSSASVSVSNSRSILRRVISARIELVSFVRRSAASLFSASSASCSSSFASADGFEWIHGGGRAGGFDGRVEGLASASVRRRSTRRSAPVREMRYGIMRD